MNPNTPSQQEEFYTKFLKISSAFNTGTPSIQTGKALRELANIIANTGPMNPLHVKAVDLREDIIRMDNNTRKAPSTPATILTLPLNKKR